MNQPARKLSADTTLTIAGLAGAFALLAGLFYYLSTTSSRDSGTIGSADNAASQPSGYTVYRYQDAEGVWHFTSEKPTDAQQTARVETITVAEPMTIQMDKPTGLSEPVAAAPSKPRVVIIGSKKNKQADGSSDDPAADISRQMRALEDRFNAIPQ